MSTDSKPVRSVMLAAVAAVLSVSACKSRATSAPADDAARATPPVEVASVMEAEPRGRVAEPKTVPPRDHGHDHAADCPIPDLRDPDLALDEAANLYDRGELAISLACTELAVDLIPHAVEAHHLHAAALAALERYPEAQNAFAMALALDPDDPETLAAAADFHINVAVPKRRAATLLGLEYARRGSDKASSRRQRDKELRARLALLEGQALNDLGRSDEALSRIDETLAMVPDSIAARYERGVSLFNQCRFDTAYTELAEVLRAAPEDPYAHHYLGLIYERGGRDGKSSSHFDRARKLAPDDFPQPILLSEVDFRAELAEAMAELPADVAPLLEQVRIEVSDIPLLEDLTAVDPPFAPTILGLYRGLPVGAVPRDPAEPSERVIVLYRKNLARAVRSRDELDQQIRRTLQHEIGHLRGLDEGQLRRRGLE